MKCKYLFVLLLISSFGRGQVISTIAGGGTIFPPNGSQATVTNIGLDGDICYDKFGNLYIECQTGYIFKVDIFGSTTIFAGTGVSGYGGDNGPATDAKFNTLNGIVSDSKGNLFLTDQHNQRIRKIDMYGVISTYAGTGTLGHSGDNGPATVAQLYYPKYLAIDSNNNLYFDEYSECTIRKIDTNGIITTICGTPGVNGYSGDNGPASAALLSFSNEAISVDFQNNLLITDNTYIRKINLTTGIITTIAGNGGTTYTGDNGPATAASFVYPIGVCANREGVVFVSDIDNNRVRKIDDLGIITTIVGNGTGAYNGDNIPASAAEIYSPRSVCLDSCGNLCISDNGNSRIRKVTFDTSCHFYGALANRTVNVRPTGSVDVFPNPADEAFTISTFDKTVIDYFITNSTGKIFWNGIANDAAFRINISQWPNGLYFLHARRQDGTEEVKKVVKD